MAKTIDELTKQFLDLCIEVNDNMKKLINTKGEKVDGDYAGMRYVPTESQQKSLAFFADRKIVSVGISDKISGGIYVEEDKRVYTAFNSVAVRMRVKMLACLAGYLTI